MTNGIYYYYDTEKNFVVYVGKDSYIDKNRRHKAHISGNGQQIDSIFQNNPDRYEYRVYCEGNFSNEELNDLEIQTIKLFDTFHRKDTFNYTEGGDGFGSGENHPMYGRTGENNPMYGITGEDHPKWKDYARVIKKGIHPNGKQRYALVYNGEILIQSINKEELEKLADRINKLKNKDEEIIEQIIEEYKARKENYARVIKNGTHPSGKQNYALMQNGKIIKRSIYKEKLEKLAEEINAKKDKRCLNEKQR